MTGFSREVEENAGLGVQLCSGVYGSREHPKEKSLGAADPQSRSTSPLKTRDTQAASVRFQTLSAGVCRRQREMGVLGRQEGKREKGDSCLP